MCVKVVQARCYFGKIPARSLRSGIHRPTSTGRALSLCHAAFHGAGGTVAGSASGLRHSRVGLNSGQAESVVVVVVGRVVVVAVRAACVLRVVVPASATDDAVGAVWPPPGSFSSIPKDFPCPRIPTGFRPKAQGCGASRYLGKPAPHFIQPQRGCVLLRPPQSHTYRSSHSTRCFCRNFRNSS